MKKSSFITLLVGVIGGLVFSLGMCMCLIHEWDAFNQGMIVTAVGLVVLLALGVISLIMKSSKTRKPINWKIVGKSLYGVFSALMLGAGMCMVMVWQMMLPGMVVGVVGIVMLICLIPMCVGFKK